MSDSSRRNSRSSSSTSVTQISRSSSSPKSESKSINTSSKGYKMSYHEMLSYGHKPWDDDYREMKAFYEKEFTRINNSSSSSRRGDTGTKSKKAGAASESLGGIWTKNKAEVASHNGYPSKTSDFTSMSEADDSSQRGYRMSTWEMLSYGHKPWDSDYWEWKEVYEKTFAKCGRSASEGKAEDASDSGYASKTSDSTSMSETDDDSETGYPMSTRDMLSHGHKPWDNDYWE